MQFGCWNFQLDKDKKMIERKFVCQKHSHRFKKMVTEETIRSGMTRCTHVDDDLLKRECGSVAWLIRLKEKESK